MPTYYALGYKGKALGQPMPLDEAEAKLLIMERCFRGLELIPIAEDRLPASPTDEKTQHHKQA